MKKNNIKNFTFIDLFAGIGGIRTAFEKLGGECVFSSEWDKYCQQTYKENFGEVPTGDIRKIDENDIPISLRGDFHAKHFRLLVKEVVLRTYEAHFSLKSQEL